MKIKFLRQLHPRDIHVVFLLEAFEFAEKNFVKLKSDMVFVRVF